MMEKKKRPKLWFIPLIVIVGLMAYIVGTTIDSFADMDACKNEFRNMIGSYEFQEKNHLFWRFDSAFANDDFWIINLGKDIRCTVFWIGWRNNVVNDGNAWLAQVNFISGQLTEGDIIKSKYW